jgi:predicted MFS family arabinose efflux permease
VTRTSATSIRRSTAGEVSEPLANAGRLLAGGILSFTVCMGVGRFFYTPLLPLMEMQAGFGPDVAGLIASVNFVGYLAGTLLAALVPKGRLRLLLFRLSLIVSIATTFATGLTDSVPMWIVLRGLAGIATALAFQFAALIVIEALAPAGLGARAGWLFGGVGVGIALSGILVRAFGAVLDWSGLWLAAGILCALAAPFILSSVKDSTIRPGVAHGRAGSMPPQLPFWPLLVNYTCEGFGYSITATFIVAIVRARPGMETIADWVWVVVGLAGLPSCIFWSAIAERAGYATALTLAYVTQLAGILLPAITDSPWAALISAVFFGGTFMAITALILAVGRQSAKGQGFAILTAGFGLGQIIGPLVAGYLGAGRAGFDTALWIAGSVIGIGLLFLALAAMQARVRETRP